MLDRIDARLARIRRFFSRTEWAIRLLRLSKHPHSDAFGLVLVQIDGLSLKQFNRGLQRKNLPFLRSLIRHEGYRVHSMYSGLPSNTPAAQAELLYGVRTAVPAFCFRDRGTGEVVRMYDSKAAQRVGERLRHAGPGLIAGGSSYCNIFSGGAEEAHFCADNNGWKALLHAANPFTLPLLVVLYADIFVRTGTLMVVELFLAVFDFVRGSLKSREFSKEFQFILTRVCVCVLMREVIVAGVCMDIARGLPVIHANFIGYDDQAHRRGPSSAFAHWSLGGIDDAARRIWKAAARSDRRDYDVWIFSDHGQERATSYPSAFGLTLEQAVKKVFADKTWNVDTVWGGHPPENEWRGELLGEAFRLREAAILTGRTQPEVLVTAMGPVGHVYLPHRLADREYGHYAERLVNDAGIPLVLQKDSSGKAHAWTHKGCFVLPDGAEQILGAEHPFGREAAVDLLEICLHADSGDFVLMGWADGAAPLSFPVESGAHAGIGPEETSAFALLTRDAPLEAVRKPYLRPSDLREAAQRFLGKDLFRFYQPRIAEPGVKAITVMTYNVHGCVGMDGRLSVDRIARVIAHHDPDIVALQELDVNRPRSLGVDQAERIARKLEMKFHFHPTFRLEDEQYGNAVFSRHPMSVVKLDALPGFKGRRTEPRGALWVAVDAQGLKFNFLNTHLSIWPVERLIQARALAGKDWLAHPDCTGPTVLCGDFNAQPRTAAYRHLCQAMRDCQRSLARHRPARTWSGKYSLSRIDHVFLSPGWEVLRVDVPRSSVERAASDHLPLVVRLKIRAEDA